MKMTKWGAGAYFEGENPKAFRPERKSGGKVNYQKKEEETVESVLDSTRILAVPQMDISLDAAKYFKIRSATDLKDGTTVVATYLPYYDKYGKLTGYKKRDWTVPKEKKGHFSVVGTVKASSQFFGQHEASMGSGKKQIFIVEGEGDVTAGWQAGFEYIKFLHSNPNTSRSVREWASNALKGIKAIQDGEEVSNCPTLPFIGLNCGTANAVDTFAHNEKFIREYEKIVLGLDNDEATAREKEHRIKKGKEATDDVAGFLLSDNIYVARYPNERNDPNGVKDIRDIYKKGKWMDIWNMFAKAQDKYVPDKLIGLERISIENLRKKKKDGVPLPCFPRLYELTRGPRTGELWTLTGPSGCVDANTEFLTPQGWKKISDYKEGDMVLQYHKDGSASFVYPSDYIKLPCESMTHVKTRFLDMMLSDEHRVIYYKQIHKASGKISEMTMKDILTVHKTKKCGFQGRIPATFNYDGPGIDMTEGELRLQVAVMADGRVVKEGKDNYTQMRFAKKRKYYRLIELCKKFGLRYEDRGSKPSERYTTGEQYEVIVWPKYPDKVFDSKYYNCSNEQLRIIADEIPHWDGSMRQWTTALTTVHKANADFVQFAYSAIGVRAGIFQDKREGKYTNTCYDVIVNKRTKYVSMAKDVRKNTVVVEEGVTPLDGFKYCFTVDTGMWVMRRNDKIIVTGNSGKSTISRKIEYAIIEYLRNMDIPRLEGWKENEKIAIIRLEEDEEESVNSLYAEELKIDPKAFVADPEQFLTDEQHLAIHQRWIAEDKVKIFDHFGSIPTDQLLQKLKQMVFLDGCRWIILDHLSMVISGLKSDNERRDLDNIMTELAAFCKKYDVFILSISHMKRKEIQIPKDKDGNLLPFWYPVRKEDLRGCLNGYVEFLTPEGWVQLKDYTPGQKVAQWADGEISFTDDVEHIRLECREDMYAFRNSSFEMTVSGEHRVLLDVEGEKQVLTAEEIAKLAKYVSFKERASIVRHYSAGNFQTSLTEWQIRAMVMFAADGCYHSNGLCKMELRKERKIERATKILDKLGVHYSHTVNKRGNTTFRTKALTEKKPLHLCHNWFIEPSHTLKILLDEVFLWDGSDKGDKGREFTSKYREECDVVQHAAHANGMSTKLYSRTVNGVTYYTLSVYREGSCKNKTSLRSLKLEREPSWDGYKYCFKVPSSYFVVRQNGVVFVTGNSAALEQLSWVVLGVEPEELPDRSRGRIRSVVMKNRPHKKLGIADTLIMDDNGQFSDASGWVWEDGMFKLNGEVMLRPKSMIQSLELETPVGKIAVSVPQQEPAVVIEQPEDLDSDSPF